MELSDEAVSSFKEIYFRVFGTTLTDQEANNKGLELLNLFKLIYKPIPKDDNELCSDKDKVF